MADPIYVRDSDKPADQKTRETVTRAMSAGFAGIKGTFEQLKRLVWANPFGLTPQQVLDLLGGNDEDGKNLSAAKLFAASDACVTLLNLTGEGITTVLPPGVTATINSDGTVTLS